MEWYKYHVTDYLSATRDLNLAQHGAYNLLLNIYYQQEGPIKVDERYVFRLVNALHWREKEAVRYVLGKFFIPIEGMYHNTRADEEILKYQRQRDANRITNRNRFGANPEPNRPIDEKERFKERAGPVDNFPQPKPKSNGQDTCEIIVNGTPCGKPASYWTRLGTHPHCRDHGPS